MAFITLVVNVMGATVPIWAGYLIFKAFAKWTGQWEVFYRNGEYYLFTAAFLSSAAFTFYKNKRRNHGMHAWAFWSMILVICVSAILFAALRVSEDIAHGMWRFDGEFLFWTSTSMMVFSVVMLFLALKMECTREPDLKEEEKKRVEDLNSDFDKLPDK